MTKYSTDQTSKCRNLKTDWLAKKLADNEWNRIGYVQFKKKKKKCNIWLN